MTGPGVSTRADRFLRACRREPVDTTPVWFMRQAGRYMAAYRDLRARHGFLDLVRSPELAVEITLQPVKAFDVDAAIVFADILPLLGALGFEVAFEAGDGPVIRNPIAAPGDVDRLAPRPVAEAVGFTLDTVRKARVALAGSVPLIGFSGAPFTLACYAIQGRGHAGFSRALAFMREHPSAWHRLMELLSAAVGDYLLAQAGAGAQAVQLFDSWAGLLGPAEYPAWAGRYSADALSRFRKGCPGVPTIHFAAGNRDLLTQMRDAGGDVIGVESRVQLVDAWDRLGTGVAVQGNLDPEVLFCGNGQIERETALILDSVRGRSGHVFNLGHGILKATPEERVGDLAAFVHRYARHPAPPAGGAA